MVPSPEGERLLVAARQVLHVNDQAVEALAHQNLSGEIAIGAIQDFADSALPRVLARFRQAHPRVRIAARVGRSKLLAESVDKGALDLAIAVHGWSSRPHEIIQSERMAWLGGADFVLNDSEIVPLVVFEPPCGFRDAAIERLNRAGRAWEIVFTSPSLSGLRAAIEAGLGVTARTSNSFQGNLRPLPAASRLPDLPTVDFALYKKSALSAPAARLCEIVVELVQAPIEPRSSVDTGRDTG